MTRARDSERGTSSSRPGSGRWIRTTRGSVLLTLAYYALAYGILPFSALRMTGDNGARCSCPMCTTDAHGSHRCPCCSHEDQCSCGVSKADDDPLPALMLDVAILLQPRRLDPALEFTGKVVMNPRDFEDRVPLTPTPPPKA